MMRPSTTRHFPGAVTFVASLLLLLSPLILGHEGYGAASSYVLGALGASLGAKMYAFPSDRDGWLVTVAGFLVLVTPWIVGFASVPMALWPHMILGFAVLAAGLWTIRNGRRNGATLDASAPAAFHDRNDGALKG